jgi:DNA repair exonuclease SbcCD ATPase subunit
MNTKEFPKLEPIPGLNYNNEEISDKKKDETQNENQIDPKLREHMENTLKKESFKNKRFFRRNSQIPSVSMNFLGNFILLNEKHTIKEEEGSEENGSLPGDSFSSEFYNASNFTKEQNDPLFVHKQNLRMKIESLKRAQSEVAERFKKEATIYEDKIKYLEMRKNSNMDDEEELENLQKINQRNKQLISQHEEEIIEIETKKMKEQKEYNDKLSELMELKKLLIKEINELKTITKEIPVIGSSFDD